MSRVGKGGEAAVLQPLPRYLQCGCLAGHRYLLPAILPFLLLVPLVPMAAHPAASCAPLGDSVTDQFVQSHLLRERTPLQTQLRCAALLLVPVTKPTLDEYISE